MQKLKATWKMVNEDQFNMTPEVRREILRSLLVDEDASWGVVRSQEALEKQLDYLMGIREDPYYTTDADFSPLNIPQSSSDT